MTIKDNVDFSVFTGFNNFDLFSNSIRRAFSYNAYGDKNIFQAVVISQPIPLDPNDSQFFLGKEDPRTNKVSRFSYRGRIIGSDSPHKFLPDPCNPNYTGEVNATNEIIALHTTFYSSGEIGNDEVLPRIGSLVEVRLEKNAYSYDLSRGAHIKVVKNPSDPTAATDTCESIQSIMESAEATGATSAADHKVYNDRNLLNPEFKPLVDKLVANLKGKGYSPLVYETWRSLGRQKYLYETGASGKAKAGLHGMGMAVDIIDGRPHPDNPSLKVGWGSYESSKRKKKPPQTPTAGDIEATKMATEFFDALGAEAAALGLEWGGSWKSLVDKPHVQAPAAMAAKGKSINTYEELVGTPTASEPTEGLEGSGGNAKSSSGTT